MQLPYIYVFNKSHAVSDMHPLGDNFYPPQKKNPLYDKDRQFWHITLLL